MNMSRTAGRLFVVALAIVPAAAHALDITTCYQSVPPGEVGVLQADLDCDGTGGPNVGVERGARLQLNGHTISGGYLGVLTGPPFARAVIEGPGEIIGASGTTGLAGCGVAIETKTTIRNVTIRNNKCGIGRFYNFALVLEDVTIRDNAVDGIPDAALSDPGRGAIKARNLTVTGNGGVGIRTLGRYRLREASVTNNAGGGLYVASPSRGFIKESALTGNGPAGDIAALVAPKLINSTCDNSQNLSGGGTLGLCSND